MMRVTELWFSKIHNYTTKEKWKQIKIIYQNTISEDKKVPFNINDVFFFILQQSILFLSIVLILHKKAEILQKSYNKKLLLKSYGYFDKILWL